MLNNSTRSKTYVFEKFLVITSVNAPIKMEFLQYILRRIGSNKFMRKVIGLDRKLVIRNLQEKLYHHYAIVLYLVNNINIFG